MASLIAISPNAFVTEAEVEAFLVRTATLGTPAQDVFARAINWATAQMESGTRRKLHHRNYTVPRTITCTTAEAGAQVTSAAAFLNGTRSLYVDDDIIATSLGDVPEGARIASIESASSLYMTLATAAGAGGAGKVLTFGSRRMLIPIEDAFDQVGGGWGGAGLRQVYLPERPLNDLWALYWIDANGTRTALDLTNAIIDYDMALIRLTNDSIPAGALAIEAECNCGYWPPTSIRRGHTEEWNDAVLCSYAYVGIYWQLYQVFSGRFGDIGAGQFTASVSSKDLPVDITSYLERYKRRTI